MPKVCQHVAQFYQILFVPMSAICKISISFMSEFLIMISFKRILYCIKDGNKKGERQMTDISNFSTIIADLYLA